MISKYNRLSVKCILTAFIIAAAFWSPRAAAQEALPGNVIASLKNAATISRQPNDVLALVVITVIANYPHLLEPVIAKALELAPQERYALAEQVVASFPGYTNRVLAATNIYKPQPTRYARPPAAPASAPYYPPLPQVPPPQAAQERRYAPIPAAGAPRAAVELAAAPNANPGAKEEKKGWGIISEIRGGVFKHAFKFTNRAKERGIDGNLEVLFISPDWLDLLWSPRPHLGSSFNDREKDLEQFYGGITWEWEPIGPTFVDFSFGFSVHNGVNNTDDDNGVPDPDAGRRREMGCKVLFRESLEFGFRFASRHGLSAIWDHISNGGLCSKENEGMDNLGVRYGYSF